MEVSLRKGEHLPFWTKWVRTKIKPVTLGAMFFFFSIGKWLVPPTPPKPKPVSQRIQDSLPQQFSLMYWRNNKQFIAFLFVLTVINVILFVMRAHYFKDFATLSGATPNGFYMMSR